jgi:predicted Zn-dependent protease
MREARPRVPETQFDSLVNARALLAVAQKVLDARIARAERRYAAAVRLLQDAVRGQDALAYDEPRDFYPVREALGAALLEASRPGEAAAVFRADLARNPRNGRSLLGLAESLNAAGDAKGAAQARVAFHAAWRTADAHVRVRDF